MRMEKRRMDVITAHDIMHTNLNFVKIGTSVSDAAKIMQKQGFGILPVGSEHKITGIITNRDIVARVVAQEKNPKDTIVGEIMSKSNLHCLEFDDLKIAAKKMHENRINYLLVKSDSEKIVGIVSLKEVLKNIYV